MATIPSDLFDLLKTVVEDNIDEYTIEAANNEKGENFIGEIIILTLTHRITSEKKHLIVKQEKEENGKILEESTKLFEREIYFYKEIWPHLQNYYETATGEVIRIVPKCLGTFNTGRKRIILENITYQGYELYDKTKPFDDNHWRYIFKTYGIFHGVSMALRERDTEQYNKFASQIPTFFKTNEKEKSSNHFAETIRKIKDYFDPIKNKPILEKLTQYEKSGSEIMQQARDNMLSNQVIVHGDCWSNNLMFKYDEHRILIDIRLLDFQLLHHGHPVFDLSYCFYSGAREETLNNLDEYLKIYHSSLSDTLNKFGLDCEKVYPLKIFKEDWKKIGKFGLPVALFIWRIKLLDNDTIPNVIPKDIGENIMKVSEHLKGDYERRIRELVIHLYNNDFL